MLRYRKALPYGSTCWLSFQPLDTIVVQLRLVVQYHLRRIGGMIAQAGTIEGLNS